MTSSPPNAAGGEGPLAIVCGGGSLPFAVADAAVRQGRKVLLFALTGWADPQRIAGYKHHWVRMGQYGRFKQLAQAEGCRDLVFIGAVGRPAMWLLWPDLGTLRLLPRVLPLFKGGDNHLLSGLGRVFEGEGFRLVGAHEIAPEILMPLGKVAGRDPNDAEQADIARGVALLQATAPFDVGQAVVVAHNNVVAVEGPEGTDQMLTRVAELRRSGRIRTPNGVGVLVKAAKVGQDHRLDLPSIGPRTVESVKRAGLAGIAVLAGSTVVAEPEKLAVDAASAGVFVVGVAP
ncbi:MAG: UDP-2,3-diacylglucosamine diphosphatase LpxI [Pseudomonadota bacterium]